MKKYDVLAIGELNVDMIVTGLKGMPVAGREIIAEGCSVVLGSSTAICACGISKLGLKTGFLGKLGRDKFSEVVIDTLKKYEVDLDNIIIDENISTGITISLSMERDRALVTYLGSIEALKLEDINLRLLKETKHIHVGSYFLQNNLRSGIPKLFEEAQKNNVTTSLDTGWDDTENWDYGIMEVLKYTDIFFPNEVEALNITRKKDVRDALEELSKYAKMVAIKCGPTGAIGSFNGEIMHQETFDLKPVDTTGAGDSFNAGFIYSFLKGYDFEKCLCYGNACGSISVTRVGGASSCATLSEAEELINIKKRKIKTKLLKG